MNFKEQLMSEYFPMKLNSKFIDRTGKILMFHFDWYLFETIVLKL